MKPIVRPTQTQTLIAGALAFVTALVLGFVVSCAPSGGGRQTQGAAGVGKYDHLDAEEKIAMSDVLADEAEEKVKLATLNEAWGGFAEALQLNPSNHRAQFWYEFIKPVLAMKGMIARIRPLYLKQESGLDRYTELQKTIERESDPEWNKFLKDGPGDIDSDEKAREWMDQTIVSLDTLRLFLKANKDRAYTLRSPMALFALALGRKKNDRCAALSLMNSDFKGCSEQGMVPFKVNRADLEMLQYIVSAEMLQIALLYAFNLNPIVIFENTQRYRTFKEKIEFVTKGYDGSILSRNRLSLADSMLEDWIVAQRYVILNQAELCKNGKYRVNRRGYLISEGLCFEDLQGTQEKKTLEIMEMILAGRAVDVDVTFASTPVSIYPIKFFKEPPKSILPFVPTGYTADGEALTVDEAPFSSYFASGTMGDVLQAKHKEHMTQLELRQKAFEESERIIRGMQMQNTEPPPGQPAPLVVPSRERR